MFCPECGVEYRAGFTRCSDCQVDLVAEPPASEDPGSPDMDPTTVFTTCNPTELAFVKSMLQQARIPFLVRGDEHGNRMEALQAFPWYLVQVPRKLEAEARSLLDELTAGAE